MADVLTVDHLQKKFGKFQALKDITFSIHPGEVFGFIGPMVPASRQPSGRCSAFCAQLLAGQPFLAKTRGRCGQHPQAHRYVPGDVNLWPNLSGGEVIDFLLRLNGQWHTARTDELIKDFDLDVSKKARTYSKGNRQKVALVAAFSSQADLYIFDEPTSGLDPLMEEVFQREVLALKQTGKSVLLSSHILSEVERMCDRIAIIRQGEIIEVGSLARCVSLVAAQCTSRLSSH